jgi:hypothetical protein
LKLEKEARKHNQHACQFALIKRKRIRPKGPHLHQALPSNMILQKSIGKQKIKKFGTILIQSDSFNFGAPMNSPPSPKTPMTA